MNPLYAAGEVCFAKVKGYPPWPALVQEVLPGSKYKIFFYGTCEHANVLSKDMQKATPDNISKIATESVKKRKWYSEGLEEMKGVMYLNGAQANVNGQKVKQVTSPSKSPLIKDDESAFESSMNPVVRLERKAGQGLVGPSPSKRPAVESSSDLESVSKKQKKDDIREKPPQGEKRTSIISPLKKTTLTEDPYKRVSSTVTPSGRLVQQRMSKENALKATQVTEPAVKNIAAAQKEFNKQIVNKLIEAPKESRKSVGSAKGQRKSLQPAPREPRKSMGTKGQVRKSIDQLKLKTAGSETGLSTGTTSENRKAAGTKSLTRIPAGSTSEIRKSANVATETRRAAGPKKSVGKEPTGSTASKNGVPSLLENGEPLHDTVFEDGTNGNHPQAAKTSKPSRKQTKSAEKQIKSTEKQSLSADAQSSGAAGTRRKTADETFGNAATHQQTADEGSGPAAGGAGGGSVRTADGTTGTAILPKETAATNPGTSAISPQTAGAQADVAARGPVAPPPPGPLDSNDVITIKIGRIENVEITMTPRAFEQVLRAFPAFSASVLDE